MKHFLIFLVVMSLMIIVGTVAQMSAESDTSEDKEEVKPVVVEPTVTPSPNTSKAPRVYPIAPGVWYPGQPLPEKPFRYYRIRCWPGCHHGSPYGLYPDEPIPGESKTETQESESQAPPPLFRPEQNKKKAL